MDPSRIPSPHQDVIEANEAFYRAFAGGDLAALTALFAEGEVATAHPWRPAVHGREEVLRGWAEILEAGAPPIRCLHPQVALVGEDGDVAVVTCLEDTGGEPCIATNVYVRQPQGWRLAHHHGAPLAPVFLPEPEPGPVH